MVSLSGARSPLRAAPPAIGTNGLRSLLRRWLACGFAAGLALAVGTAASAAQPSSSVDSALKKHGQHLQTPAFKTTVDYVVQFYPLWFTYYQSVIGNRNRLIGPERISPIYKAVVAINDDTLYGSTFLDLTGQPVILTIPETTVRYSLLTLTPYGDIFQTKIPSETSGTYGLVGPRYKGTLPQGVTRIDLPLDFQSIIFRADRYSSSNEDETEAANTFRKSITMQLLCDYLNAPCPDGKPSDKSGGATLILPEIVFSEPFKQTADFLATRLPIEFLRQLQIAVASSNTPPLTAKEKALSDAFDQLFQGGNVGDHWLEFRRGAQAAHQMILDNYLDHTGATNWINFENIGDWGDNVLDRSSITEFIQYGNGFDTAAYFHAFKDGQGKPLRGGRRGGYVLTFPKDGTPDASRFWSITAYTPDAVELVPNPANKYLVARYTPNLTYDQDGSLSIYLTQSPPPGKPIANWLPIPKGPFNVMLRVYGPEGSVASGDYVPPAIQKLR